MPEIIGGYVIQDPDEGFLCGYIITGEEILADFTFKVSEACLYPEITHAGYVLDLLKREGYENLSVWRIGVNFLQLDDEVTNEPVAISSQTRRIATEGVPYTL